ncbi:hypothetical protein T01_11590 [Trichinella spiralis]|uniref:Uncharacterized protein n=1 Tax=Trichinella spiralis TaxID=6334 RepID=A0A0V1BP60_TRISP|nr:hypothetical protein T01_11590 [Trichinella spiralis]
MFKTFNIYSCTGKMSIIATSSVRMCQTNRNVNSSATRNNKWHGDTDKAECNNMQQSISAVAKANRKRPKTPEFVKIE